jgi:hypothetical protein
VLALVLVALVLVAAFDSRRWPRMIVGADGTVIKVQFQGSADSAGVCLGVCFQLYSARALQDKRLRRSFDS